MMRGRSGICRAVLWFSMTASAVPQFPGRESGGSPYGQCQSCVSSDSEPTPEQRADWESFISQELRDTPRSLLEVGSGDGLVGFWFLDHANARYIHMKADPRATALSDLRNLAF